MMRGEEAVRIRLPRAAAAKAGRSTKGKRRGRNAEEDEQSPRPAAEGMLFEALRVHRLNIASESGIAPFIVAHDRTLAEMAARRPTTLQELESVPGMGPASRSRGTAKASWESFAAPSRPDPSATHCFHREAIALRPESKISYISFQIKE